VALAALGLGVAAGPALAHGLRYAVGGGGVAVQVLFDDGNPARDMFVTVFPPSSQDRFQTGKTDANGRFLFAPDRPGGWTVIACDRMGHRLEIPVPVGQDLTSPAAAAGVGRGPAFYLKVAAGIGGILALFLLGRRAHTRRAWPPGSFTKDQRPEKNTKISWP